MRSLAIVQCTSMVALAPITSETSPWDVLDTFPKQHSRAREAKTSNCTEARHSKSLGRVEIWLMIYEGCDGLESFTRDLIGYYDGPNIYSSKIGLQKTDPRGLMGSGVAPYTPPPTSPFGGSTCRIATRCGPAFFGWGTHCGIVVETDDGIFAVDGTRGEVNNIDWVDYVPGSYGNVGQFTNYPVGVCECLRLKSIAWNALSVPRDSFGNNSNFTLGCLTGKCGVSLGFGSAGPPFGFGRKCCFEWGPSLPCHHSPTPPRPCLREGDCCDNFW